MSTTGRCPFGGAETGLGISRRHGDLSLLVSHPDGRQLLNEQAC